MLKIHLNPFYLCAVRHFMLQYVKSIFSYLWAASSYLTLHHRHSHVSTGAFTTSGSFGLQNSNRRGFSVKTLSRCDN